MIDYLEQWVNFYQNEFPGKPVPPMPKSSNKLNITEKLALENYDQGRLFQNLFGNSGLGEALGEAIQKKQVIDETAKLQEINAAKAAKVKAWSEMDAMSRMAANPPSPQAVAQARAAWGISE